MSPMQRQSGCGFGCEVYLSRFSGLLHRRSELGGNGNLRISKAFLVQSGHVDLILNSRIKVSDDVRVGFNIVGGVQEDSLVAMREYCRLNNSRDRRNGSATL